MTQEVLAGGAGYVRIRSPSYFYTRLQADASSETARLRLRAQVEFAIYLAPAPGMKRRQVTNNSHSMAVVTSGKQVQHDKLARYKFITGEATLPARPPATASQRRV